MVLWNLPVRTTVHVSLLEIRTPCRAGSTGHGGEVLNDRQMTGKLEPRVGARNHWSCASLTSDIVVAYRSPAKKTEVNQKKFYRASSVGQKFKNYEQSVEIVQYLPHFLLPAAHVALVS